MYLIPLIRASRIVVACSFFPEHPLISVASTEIISYAVPIINNSSIKNASNNLILFLFYFYLYNDSAVQTINKYKNKYIINYKLELILIWVFLFNYGMFN